MFDEKAKHQDTLDPSKCLRQTSKVECSQRCLCLARDGLPSFFSSTFRSYFHQRICSRWWLADARTCLFPPSWAQWGARHASSFTVSLSAAFTQFHPSVLLESHWPHCISVSPLFSYISSPPLFFLLTNLFQWGHCVLSIPLCCSLGVCTPVTVVKKTVKSMITASQLLWVLLKSWYFTCMGEAVCCITASALSTCCFHLIVWPHIWVWKLICCLIKPFSDYMSNFLLP